MDLVCAFCWVRKVLGIGKAHMSPSTLCCAALCAGLASGVSLVSILQTGDWTRVSSLPDITFLLTVLLWMILGFCSVSCPGSW